MGTPPLTAIDGDVVSFFRDEDLALIFTPDELRNYLTAAGHRDPDVTTTVDRWQILYLEKGRGNRWRLNDRGREIVDDVRSVTTVAQQNDTTRAHHLQSHAKFPWAPFEPKVA